MASTRQSTVHMATVDCGDWQTLRAAAFCTLCNLWKFKLVSDIQRVAVIQPRANDCTSDITRQRAPSCRKVWRWKSQALTVAVCHLSVKRHRRVECDTDGFQDVDCRLCTLSVHHSLRAVVIAYFNFYDDRLKVAGPRSSWVKKIGLHADLTTCSKIIKRP